MYLSIRLTRNVAIFLKLVPYERIHVHVRRFISHTFPSVRKFQFRSSCGRGQKRDGHYIILQSALESNGWW